MNNIEIIKMNNREISLQEKELNLKMKELQKFINNIIINIAENIQN